MARITVEDCLEQEPNRFLLVLLAAKRTKDLLRGKKSKLSVIKNKPVVSALREIAAGDVRFMTAEEAAEKGRIEAEQEAERAARAEASGFGAAESAARTLGLLETPSAEPSEGGAGGGGLTNGHHGQ